jgi:hypothetical protein
MAHSMVRRTFYLTCKSRAPERKFGIQGGLDARHLLTHIRPQSYRPLSLLTLSTPHRGSDFMAWCRANIGLGELHNSLPSPVTSARVPYSLKSPLLSRAPQESFPGLSYSLGTTLSSYLLSVLDSPAYSNLTPQYLANEFNPNTPDRSDVKYFSVGARIQRLGVWHPLWLPKLILDAAEARRIPPPSEEDKGNDGLVAIESAKWGEYLGTVESCDHWELRGAASFVRPTLSAASLSSPSASASSSTSTRAEAKGRDTSWTWRDVNMLIRRSLVSRSRPSADSSSSSPTSSNSSTLEKRVSEQPSARSSTGSGSRSLHDLAHWILSRIPLPIASRQDTSPTASTSTTNASVARSSIDPSWPVDDALVAKDKDEGSSNHYSERHQRHRQHAAFRSASSFSSSSLVASTGGNMAPSSTSSSFSPKLLYGSALPSEFAKGKDGKFDLEALYIGLCRKLYDEGF